MHSKWANQIAQFTSRNSPAILSAIAIGGVVATAVLAVRATPKAVKRIKDKENPLITNQEIIGGCWTYYVPAGLAGAATISCIIGASAIGAKREAALLAAYTLMGTSFREYKDHVIEQIGEAKEQKIREKTIQDRIKENPPEDKQVIITGGGDQLCYDSLTGRYFRGEIEKIRRAENEINRWINTNMFTSQNDFYELIGLPDTAAGNILGWNIDNYMRLVFSSHLTPDGVPCLAIEYEKPPVSKYGDCL